MMTMNTAIKHWCFHAQCQQVHIKISAYIKYNLIGRYAFALPNIILANISSYRIWNYQL